MNIENQIEAILFFKGEPMSKKKIAEILKIKEDEVQTGLEKLKINLENRGIVLVENNNEYTLGTTPEISEIIENIQKEELNKDLSKASLETLSIVLYKNGVSRSEIDYIRGVNSGFTLRILTIRGLIDKNLDPKDSRKYIYKPSFNLLSYLGIKNIEELPKFNEVLNSLNSVTKNMEEEIKKELES